MKRGSTGSHKPTRWGIYLLRKKADRLGSLDARSAEEAVELAAKEYEIRDIDKWRLSAQPEE